MVKYWVLEQRKGFGAWLTDKRIQSMIVLVKVIVKRMNWHEP